VSEPIALPEFPLTGGCACGAIRDELTRPPIALFACHCTDCQKMTGSAFSMGMPVFAKHLRLIKGEPKTWLRRAASGRVIPQRFCGDCGTRLFTEPAGDPPTFTLRPGTLDDTSWLRPAAAMWTKSAQPWISFGNILAYDAQPAEFMPIVEAWRASLAEH
jgi:hypothetical protein